MSAFSFCLGGRNVLVRSREDRFDSSLWLRMSVQRGAAIMKGNTMSGEATLNIVGPDGLKSRWPQSVAIEEWFLLIALLAIFVRRGFLPGWRTLNTEAGLERATHASS